MDAERDRSQRSDQGPKEKSLTPEWIWRELGLPGVPPVSGSALPALRQVDVASLRQELNDVRSGIRRQAYDQPYAMAPPIFELLGFFDVSRRFNDTAPPPPVDYSLLYRFVRGEVPREQCLFVVDKLVFRTWWEAERLIRYFELLSDLLRP
jgi:hypothetical protein